MSEIVINGNSFNFCPNPLWASKIGNTRDITIPEFLMDMVQYALPLICSKDLNAASKILEGYKPFHIRDKFYISAIVLLFDGFGDLRRVTCDVLELFCGGGYRVGENGSISIYNLNKASESVLDFILNYNVSDLSRVPLRSQTGFDRKTYDNRVGVMRSIHGKNTQWNDQLRKYLSDRGQNLAGQTTLFMKQDFKELLERKIKSMAIGTFDRKFKIEGISINNAVSMGSSNGEHTIQINGSFQDIQTIKGRQYKNTVNLSINFFYNENVESSPLYVEKIDIITNDQELLNISREIEKDGFVLYMH